MSKKNSPRNSSTPDGDEALRLRQQLGLTQGELASKANISIKTLQRIEQSATTSNASILKLEKALGDICTGLVKTQAPMPQRQTRKGFEIIKLELATSAEIISCITDHDKVDYKFDINPTEQEDVQHTKAAVELIEDIENKGRASARNYYKASQQIEDIANLSSKMRLAREQENIRLYKGSYTRRSVRYAEDDPFDSIAAGFYIQRDRTCLIYLTSSTSGDWLTKEINIGHTEQEAQEEHEKQETALRIKQDEYAGNVHNDDNEVVPF